MTRAALVKSADLKRMCEVAKQTGMRIEIEIGGAIVRVSPDIPDIHKPETVDLKPEDFTSLAEWQAWRERKRARETQRHS